jgi:hypothetical protein
MSTFSGGIVLAFSYTLVRSDGYLPSFRLAYIAHATHNALLLYVIGSLFPKLA